jgi:hypothetical protein
MTLIVEGLVQRSGGRAIMPSLTKKRGWTISTSNPLLRAPTLRHRSQLSTTLAFYGVAKLSNTIRSFSRLQQKNHLGRTPITVQLLDLQFQVSDGRSVPGHRIVKLGRPRSPRERRSKPLSVLRRRLAGLRYQL